MKELNYNIHDLLSIKLFYSGKEDPTANLRYSYFATPECPGSPDIIINIGSFKPSIEGAENIAHRYWIRDNYFYCRERGSQSKWEMEITGFEKGTTAINFSGRYHGIRGLVFPTFMAQEFLMPIIEYKLAKKKHFLIHGGAVCQENAGFIFTGRPGVWKTSLLLDLMRTNKYSFLGDDRIILSEKGNILSFPTSLFLFHYNLKNSRNEERNLLDNFSLLIRTLTNKAEKGLVHPAPESKSFKKIFFVSRVTDKNYQLRSVTLEEGLEKIILNNMAETVESTKKSPAGQYFNYVQMYSLIFPENDLRIHYDRMREGIREIIKDIPLNEITLPFRYDRSIIVTKVEQILKED